MPPLGAAGFTNDPNPLEDAAGAGATGGREPQIPVCAFSFSKSRILFPLAEFPEVLPAAVEPNDIVHRSSNPPAPLNFEDPAVVEVVPVVTGEFTADRTDIVGIAAYAAAGADAGVELGRTCDKGGASAALRVPKGWGCDDCTGLDVVGLVDVKRSIRFGLPAVAATGEAARSAVLEATTGAEDGAAWKSAKSSSVASGASVGSALFVVVAADAGALAPGAGTGSVSSRSSKFRTGAGGASGALPAAFDCVVDERV